MNETERKLPITIRPISDISEIVAVEDLQKEVWGCDDREVFPALALLPMCRVGAVLLGAFAGNEMVGFVFGFPGIEHGQPILHSDLLAVRPSYRGQQLGKRLKLEQRVEAMKKGISKISWTFDPLQAVNADLNFAKLGVTSDRYLVNFYGQTTSFLHSTGSDRLWVTWDLGSERVSERLRADSPATPELEYATPLLRIDSTAEPVICDITGDEQSLTIYVPSSINSLAANNLALADRWRDTTRKAFMTALDSGFIVEEFYRCQADDHAGGFYFMRKTNGK